MRALVSATRTRAPVALSAVASRHFSANLRCASDASASLEQDQVPDLSVYDHLFTVPQWNQQWIDREAEVITSRAYHRHRGLDESANHAMPLPPRPTTKELEKMRTCPEYEPTTWKHKLAQKLVHAVRPLTHLFFRDRYLAHACVLETVAAVPGQVAASMRHFRSLRKMRRDHGHIIPLLEEAANERMHLLVWMKLMEPSVLERALVIGAQFGYGAIYALMYALSPTTAHSFVGYLEVEAVRSYTMLLDAIDNGDIDIGAQAAPKIARKYWRLPEDATVRDVVLYVRADEWMHASHNFRMAEIHAFEGPDATPDSPAEFPESVRLPASHPLRAATHDSIKEEVVPGDRERQIQTYIEEQIIAPLKAKEERYAARAQQAA